MKILLVSDEESSYIWDFWNPTVFAGVDMVISCGDLHRDYLEFLATLIPVPLFYVPGNHDKHFVTDPPGGCFSVDQCVRTYQGLRIAGLGGCRSETPGSAYEYSDSVMRRRAQKLRRQIKRAGGLDILVTHAPCEGLGDGNDAFHRGFSVFPELITYFDPKYHFFGHQHKRYGRAKEQLTLGGTHLINACGYQILEY